MTAATARPTCEWFLGCSRKAIALVSHPRKPVPTCQECIDRMGLRDKIVAVILEPSAGERVVVELGGRHTAEHLFHGACICPCPDCTTHGGPTGTDVVCACPDCPPAKCGAKAATA